MLKTQLRGLYDQMLADYIKQHSKDCTQTFITPLGYDSILFLVEAIRSDGTISQGIAKGIYKLRGYPGASGSATRTAQGSVRRKVSVFQIVNGKWVLVME